MIRQFLKNNGVHKTALLWLTLIFGGNFAASAATYYVSRSGDNRNPGTQAQPFQTIQHAADVAAAGDVVNVNAGNYNEAITTVRNGSSGNKIRFHAQGNAVIRTFDINHHYITVDGFEITDTNRSHTLRVQGHHCEISNNSIHNTGAEHAVIYMDSSTSECVIKNNRFYSEHGPSRDLAVIFIRGNYHLIENNEIGPMFDIDAFRIFGHDNVIRGNYVHDAMHSPGSSAHMDVFQTYGLNDGESYDIVFENNLIVNFDGQICMTEHNENPKLHDWDIRNNVFANIPTQANIGIPNLRWYNNTFYNVGSNNRLVFSGSDNRPKGTAEGLEIRNNIIIAASNISQYNQVMAIDRVGLSGVAIDYNYVATLDSFSPLTNFTEENGVNGANPQFISITANDFRLRQNSPATDAGMTLGGFLYDHDGAVRPQGIRWDIGAFEYTSDAPLTAPTDLRVLP